MSRLYGKYKGWIINACDPEGRGRVKVEVPGVYPSDEMSPKAYGYEALTNTLSNITETYNNQQVKALVAKLNK